MPARGRVVVTLEGPAVAQGRIAVDDLVLVAAQLQRAVERVALVLRGEEGMRPGRRPREVQDLTRLEVVALRSGSITLELDLAAGERPLEGMDVGRRAVEGFVRGLAALSEQTALSEQAPLPAGWDAGVLLAAKEMAAGLRRGLERIEIEVHANGARRRARLDLTTVEVIGRLISRPVRNLQTVEGRLLMADFKETGSRCRVHPPMGPPVECTFDEAHRHAVLDALTRYVRVSGEAQTDEATGRVRQLAIADIEIVDVVSRVGEGSYPFWERLEVEELAHLQGVQPVRDLASLAAPMIWESSDELEAFLDETYRARRSENA